MSANNKHRISEKELDNLLNQSFLNLDFNKPENEKLMETISNELLQVKSATGGFTGKAFYIRLLMVATMITTAVVIYLVAGNTSNRQPSIAKKEMQLAVPSLKEQTTQQYTQHLPEKNTVSPVDEQTKEEIKQTGISQIIMPEKNKTPLVNYNQQPAFPPSGASYFGGDETGKNEDSLYVFPKLTEKEIKATVKQKEKMINWLFKQSKERYSLITPKAAGPVTSDIADTNATFYIQNYEVSNLEYRTFLFDLLLNDRKQEFLIAKPYQSLWMNTLGSTEYDVYKDVYFSDKRFDEYPVVNISKEGAELYCEWLSNLSKKGYARVAVRLPYTNEWLYAAKGGLKGAYPWGTDTMYNPNGCYYANFCVQKNTEKLNAGIRAKCSAKKYTNAYTSAGMMLGDSVLSVMVSSYNPNNYGLYCMSGNVAEMAVDAKTKSISALGGSWDSDFEHCRITNSENKNAFKANQMTGFRPVFRIVTEGILGMTKREDPKTGIPVMTPDEIQSYQKSKKKMLDAVINCNKNDYAYIPMGSCIYRNDTVSVQSFYMQTTEVTNLQYRTFLFDLLQQGRAEEFLQAKPDQKAWNTKFPSSYNQPMELFYFAHPAYDDYPVINISRKAAQMYCIWLSQECNALLKERGKALMNDVRLPVDIEWAYAASSKQNSAKYATGHTYLRDSKGRYEMNYSGAEMSSCAYDSARHLYIPYLHKPVNTTSEDDAKFITDGAFHTAYTRSYQPNNYGLYCMAGNAAEMVTVFNMKTRKPEKPGTKGGSWFSCDYFLEIDATEENPGDVNPSPMIGFRPVITALLKK